MEKEIENVLSGIISTPNTIGCMVVNNQGLCLEKKGTISDGASGIMVAILEQASKLEPNSNPPVISLESGNRTCLIHKHGVTGIVYKELAKPELAGNK